MEVIFLADAGVGYGLGHLIRCLEIANNLPFQREEVLFLLPDDTRIGALINDKGFKQISLLGKKTEAEILQHVPSILVTDFRENTTLDWEKLREYNIFIASIDDLGRSKLKSDMVFNPNLYAGEIDYTHLPQNTRLFKGIDYCILREEIRKCGLKAKTGESYKGNHKRNILITFGGNDRNNLSYKVCSQLINATEYDVHVVLPVFRDPSEIVNLISGTSHIRYSHFVANIEEMYVNSDLVICGGGTTLSELAYLGCPTLCIPQASYEEFNAGFFESRGTLINIGYADFSGELFLSILGKTLNDDNLLNTMKTAGRSLIDEKGVERVASLIMEGVRSKKYEQ